jgi:hypothetical protein
MALRASGAAVIASAMLVGVLVAGAADQENVGSGFSRTLALDQSSTTPRQSTTPPRQSTAPPRDAAGQQPQAPAVEPTGRISGRVTAADSGRPVRGARVSLNAPSLTGGRTVVTDDSGAFDFQQLPEGRYTLSVAKTGFVTLSYGQRRPMQPGTPLQLGVNQTLRDLEMRLPRGSAIGGQISDENGEPMPGIMVRVMREQLTQGQRRLTAAGSGTTDDRGQYRVWGLNPGEYYVSAVSPNMFIGNALADAAGRGGRGGRGGGPPFAAGGGPPGRGRAGIQVGAGQAVGIAGLGDLDTLVANMADLLGGAAGADGASYAPTYYPGVSSSRDAGRVNVGLAAETLGIDFSLMRVRMAKVSGRVTSADGTTVGGGMINLGLADDGGGRGGPLAGNYGGRIQNDGTFTISNVPPGSYVLRARSGPGGRGGGQGQGPGGRGGQGGGSGSPPRFASMPLHVSDDLTDVNVVLSPGASISGTIVLQLSGATQAPDLNQVRVFARPADSSIGEETPGRVDRSGTFTLDGVPAGPHWFRAQAPRGLSLKSVLFGGRDIVDTTQEIRPGDRISGVSFVFTDRVSEIIGTISDGRGTAVTDFTVLAFPEESDLWRPESRHILTTRPDQNGKFQLRGLPPGRYFVVAIDPTSPGQWFDPAFLDQQRDGAARVTLAEGETKTQDFRVGAR